MVKKKEQKKAAIFFLSWARTKSHSSETKGEKEGWAVVDLRYHAEVRKGNL
jgi:hypothetical protein